MLHAALRPFAPLLQDLCRRFGVQQMCNSSWLKVVEIIERIYALR